jgi:tetratricopeptide (TPR) repeat protein
MGSQTQPNRPTVLEIAWRHYAELDANALAASKLHLNLRWWVIVLSVAATLLAILTEMFGNPTPQLAQFFEAQVSANIALVLRIGLILVPIINATVLSFANKIHQGERWLALRTGAEEIVKEIFFYRTVLQQQDGREQWLNERLTAIQRQVFEGLGGDMVLQPYTGLIPPHYSPANPNSDPGFNDLLAEEYIQYRLGHQLQFHSDKIQKLQDTRNRLQLWVFIFGMIGAALAALAVIEIFSGLSVWVALTTSIATAITSWQELRRLDSTINNYGKLILELQIIQNHWRSLPLSAQNGDEFFKMVNATEQVLWSQHSQYISEMRKAVAGLQGQESDMLNRVMNSPAPVALDNALQDQAKKTAALPAPTLPAADLVKETPETTTTLTEPPAAQQTGQPAATPVPPPLPAAAPPQESPQPIPAPPPPEKKLPKGLPHAFVVMPFGRKQGPDGRWIDFNSVYNDLIKPALLEAGFEPFRADEEAVSGDILTDMFQELLLADLVIADLSIDNANVFYELGVRHSLRKRGLVHIQSGRAYLPFDIFNVRTVPYRLDKNGRPDPEFLEKDCQAITKIARETWASNIERVHSPIFNLLDGLSEPDRKALRTPLATGYWREYYDWEERVEIAQRQKRIGDVLLLTEEVGNPLIKEDIINEAGEALRSLGRYELALQQYRAGLKINPHNTKFRREEAFHLGRLQRYDEAIVKLERLLQDYPTDTEAIAYLGRIYREMWAEEWHHIKDEEERCRIAHKTGYWLKRSFDTYLSGYQIDQNHFFSGVNALSLAILIDDLAHRFDEGDDDPEIAAIHQQIPQLKGAVQFNLESQVHKLTPDFWAFLSVDDLSVCLADDPKEVVRAYNKALTLAGENRFALRSSLVKLETYAALGFRPEFVQAALSIVAEQVQKLDRGTQAEEGAKEHKVFLFSGHMIDRPGRPEPRFPAAMEPEVQNRIEQALVKLGADTDDIAILPGAACGGDIIFIEACLKHNMKVDILLPFTEPEFIRESISFAGDEWVTRFYTVRNHPHVTIRLQADHVGPLPFGDNPFERNNRWALYSALIYGIERIRLVALWDGKGGDGPGGTGHMVSEVRRLGGIAEHLDITKFDYWQAQGKVGEMLDGLVNKK